MTKRNPFFAMLYVSKKDNKIASTFDLFDGKNCAHILLSFTQVCIDDLLNTKTNSQFLSDNNKRERKKKKNEF